MPKKNYYDYDYDYKSDEQENLPTGGGVCKNLSSQKARVGDGGELEHALGDATRYDHIAKSDLRKKITLQIKPLKFSDCGESIRKQTRPGCGKLF